MRKFAFLLIPEFQLQGVVSAVEALRVANSLYPEPVFSSCFVHDTEPVVRSSGGIPLTASCHVGALEDFDALIVSASFRHQDHANPATRAVLRRFARYGKTLGSFESGVYYLALAGVLDGHAATAHFNNQPLFAQLFPEVHFVRRVFTCANRRMTAAGGSACMDLMLHIIETELGRNVAARVAGLLIHSYRRDQDMALDNLFTSANNGLQPVLREACRRMEERIDHPSSVEQIARDAGVSRRHLDRLFLKAFGSTTSDYFRQIRLSRARKLVRATDLDLADISLRCGFGSYSHFVARYRATFGTSPSADRQSEDPSPGDPDRFSPSRDLHPFQSQMDRRRMI